MKIDDVQRAYHSLKREGTEPSSRNVHRHLGYGSRRDLVRLLRQVKWEAEGGSVCPICDELYREQYPKQATCLAYACGKEFNRQRLTSI